VAHGSLLEEDDVEEVRGEGYRIVVLFEQSGQWGFDSAREDHDVVFLAAAGVVGFEPVGCSTLGREMDAP
jgi:hypothetical protein